MLLKNKNLNSQKIFYTILCLKSRSARFNLSRFNFSYLDNTHGDGLTHVADREATQGRKLLEGLDAHRLGRLQHHDGGVTALYALWILLGGLAGTAVAFLLDFSKLAGNVSGVAVEHWRVAVADLSRVIQDDDLGGEVGGTARRLILGVAGDVTAPQLLHGDVFHVEANIVAGQGFRQRLVMHLDGFHLGGESRRRESYQHTLKLEIYRFIYKNPLIRLEYNNKDN